MIKIITAINNPKIKFKNKERIKIIGKNIFYKEGILEILENKKNIDYIIIENNLPGEININKLIEKILNKNNKIKIIILIKEKNEKNRIINFIKDIKIKIKKYLLLKIEQKSFYQIQKFICKILENEKENFCAITENENVIKVNYKDCIDFNKMLKIKDTKNKINQKIDKTNEKKEVIFIGNSQVGKTMSILLISYLLERKDKKILIMETDKQKNDIIYLVKKVKKNIENLKITLSKNIDFVFYTKKDLEEIQKMKNKYDYIFIEMNLKDINLEKIKIIRKINNNILILKPNLLEIKNTKFLLEKNDIKNFKILINNFNEYSIDEKIIKNIFYKNKILGKIKYNFYFEKLINNNFKILKIENQKILKQYQKIISKI